MDKASASGLGEDLYRAHDDKGRLNEIIKDCHSFAGQQSHYLLKARKINLNEDGTLRRWTYGEKDEKKSCKTILMVGETGTGKTTLINTIINYILGVKFEDKVWFEITNEEDDNQTHMTVYEIYVKEAPFSLIIIDTPGYGDTRGLKYDQQIAENLYILCRSVDGIHEIDAVGLVVKASQNRLTDSQKYIFDAVLSLFGKDIEQSIVIFVTHSDGAYPKNPLAATKKAKVPYAQENNTPVYFLFNNYKGEAFQAECEESDGSVYRTAWNLGVDNMKKFLEHLEKMQPKSLRMTKEVLRQRKQLAACVQNLQDRIKMMELKQTELEQTQEALNDHKKEMERNQNFEYEVDEAYKEKVPIQQSWWLSWLLYTKATCCPVCEENCHYPGCWWVRDLSWCSVMSGNHCTVCTGKCHYTQHVKEEKIYELRTRRVKKTHEDVKMKYMEEEGKVKEKESLVSRIQSELREVESEKIRLVKEAYQCVMTLEETAMESDSFSTLRHLDFLIEKMEETGDKVKAQKLRDIKQRADSENGGARAYIRA
ncbi:immune-associated nucleotide-binding protein 12-like [Chanos chanos]|uniref:Immune-associated nucleotide-binding protein 12-like n=1 Tax=Chanos chanos TaxID=29144 RepID=A0A6J2USJ6_CHACN|nr:immune-associated nucleotide-binding protein 12-like [Chanos chanos]